MSGDRFDQLEGLTFADFDQFAMTNARMQRAMEDDPKLRATCPKCKDRWEGTFEELSKHVEGCREGG